MVPELAHNDNTHLGKTASQFLLETPVHVQLTAGSRTYTTINRQESANPNHGRKETI